MNEERKKIHRPHANAEAIENLENIKKEDVIDPGVIERVENIESTIELPEFKENIEMAVQSIEPVNTTQAVPSKSKKKRTLGTIVNVLLFLLLFAWLAVVVVDFLHVKRKEEPQFCVLSNKTTNYSDGKVNECMGLGYKVITYDRASFKAVEFGPFWIEDRTAQK